MIDLLDGLKAYLISNGIVVQNNSFLGYVPDSPDNVVSIYGRGGPTPDSKLPYDELSIQFLVRGTQAWPIQKGQAIYDTLHGLTDIELNGVWIVSCLAQNAGPAFLGRDAAQRPEYSLNFNIEVRNDNPASVRVGG